MSNHLMRLCLVPFFCAFSLYCYCLPARAESEEERRERIERIEQLKRTEEVAGESSRLWSEVSKRLGWYVDYGGTVRYTYTGGDDNDRDYRVQDSLEFTKDYELNTFINFTDLTKKSKFYGRFHSTYTQRKKNAATTRGNEWTQLEVDALYYERKFKSGKGRTTLTLGRQSTSVGRGIAYSQTGDGAQVAIGHGPYDLTGFYVAADRSPDDNDPGALSPPSRGHTHRRFLGAELKYSLHPKLRPYVFAVHNDDRSQNIVDLQTNQLHIYDSKFLGYGLNGNLTPRLTYFAEFISVTGSTVSVGDKQDTTIVESRAYDVGLRYALPGIYQPSISVERAYASGDPDRQSTVNSVNLGNTANKDMAFRSFGGLGLGYALAPTLSNMRVKKYSGSFSPFAPSSRENLKNMRLTLDFYRYWKDQEAGPTSDFAITSETYSKEEIGKEFNVQMNWQMLNDLVMNVRWGKFKPGEAYGTILGGVQKEFGGAPEIYWRVQWSLDI